MSKPLATKVSTPLNENVQIGPKVSIFCVATIIFQHCLNPLGHGVHQSFTGCHWSPLPLLHDDITELVDVRDLALLHLPFEDAPHITFFSKAVVILEVCLGSLSCWNTALRLNLRRRGSCSALVCHITCWHSWFPQWTVAPQCRQHSCSPRPWHSHHQCLTVGKTHLTLYSSPGCRHYGKLFWLLLILRIWILDINNSIFTSNNLIFLI